MRWRTTCDADSRNGRARHCAGFERETAIAAQRCDFERFVFAHRRQQARQALREHALARARRADHHQAVLARSRDLERAFRLRLTAHVAQVRMLRGDDRRRGALAKSATRAGSVRDDIEQMLRGRDATSRHEQRLRDVVRRHDHAMTRAHRPRSPRAARRAPGESHRRATARRTARTSRTAAARHCSDATRMPSAIGRSKRTPSFGRSAGDEIDGDAPVGHAQTAVDDRRAHAILALVHDGFGQADDREARQAAAEMDFDAHQRRVHAVLRAAQDRRTSLAPSWKAPSARVLHALRLGVGRFLAVFQRCEARFQGFELFARAAQDRGLNVELLPRTRSRRASPDCSTALKLSRGRGAAR